MSRTKCIGDEFDDASLEALVHECMVGLRWLIPTTPTEVDKWSAEREGRAIRDPHPIRDPMRVLAEQLPKRRQGKAVTKEYAEEVRLAARQLRNPITDDVWNRMREDRTKAERAKR